MTDLLVERWRALARAGFEDAVTLRHRIHGDPRLSGDEEDTAALVAAAIGPADARRVAGTGRVIRVEGRDDDRPAIALRAELDALPIEELTGVSWRSTNGAMHACGHDVHLAALTMVARAASQAHLPASLVALLQPREEGADSGAFDVLSENGLDGVGAIIAAHLQPRLSAGVIAVAPGPVNAGSVEFDIAVTGRGGHSGYPHTVSDPVLALASIVVGLQQLPARRIDPVAGVACMVTEVHAGARANVVPGHAAARGTLRTMGADDLARSELVMSEIVTHTAAAHGCEGTLAFELGEPPLVNDHGLATAAKGILAGMGHSTSADFRSFGSDDFSHYCARLRALMMFVGTGSEGGVGLHDGRYLPGDEYIATVADALIAGYCAALTG